MRLRSLRNAAPLIAVKSVLVQTHRAAVRRDQPHDEARDRRLAGTGLADETEGLALQNIEIDLFRGMHDARRPEPAAAAHIGLVETNHLDGLAPIGERRPLRRLHRRHGGEQRTRVRMLRPLQDIACRALLDHLAMLKHDHAIGDIGDDAEIVGDEHHRHVAATLQVADQLENLRLRRDVQRRRRLVGDQHGRLQRQRHGDHRALTLAAGQLMRIGAHRPLRVRQADLAQQLERFLLSLPRRQEIMRLEHLGDLLADPHQGVQRRHRLLKHHGDVAAAERQPRALIKRQQVLPLEDDLAGFRRNVLRQQPHQRVGAHRLAGAGFADDAEDFSGGEIERHVVHRVGTIAAGRQRQPQLFDGDGRICRHAQRPSLLRRGLSASLRPSPIRFSASTETRIATPGNSVIHHACRITVRPAPTM